MPHFLGESKKEREPDTFADLMRPSMDRIDECEALDPRIKRAFSFEEQRGGQLEDETERHFCWWRPGFRYQKPKEEVEHEIVGTQECEERVDVFNMTHESPLLDIPLVAPVDSLVERVEHTLSGPFVDEEPPMDEMSSIVEGSIDEVSRAKFEF